MALRVTRGKDEMVGTKEGRETEEQNLVGQAPTPSRPSKVRRETQEEAERE